MTNPCQGTTGDDRSARYLEGNEIHLDETYPALVLDLPAADMDPLARLGRCTTQIEFLRGDHLVVVETRRDYLVRRGRKGVLAQLGVVA